MWFISKRIITLKFSGSGKVRNRLLVTQPYSLLLSNDGMEWMPCPNPNYCSIVQDGKDHTLRIFSQIFSSRIKYCINKHLSLLNWKKISNLFTSRKVFSDHSLWNDNWFIQLQNLGLQKGRSTFNVIPWFNSLPGCKFYGVPNVSIIIVPSIMQSTLA